MSPTRPDRRSRRRPLLRWAVLALAALALLGGPWTVGMARSVDRARTADAAQAATPVAAAPGRPQGMTPRGGWYPWEPYQYLKKEGERKDLIAYLKESTA